MEEQLHYYSSFFRELRPICPSWCSLQSEHGIPELKIYFQTLDHEKFLQHRLTTLRSFHFGIELYAWLTRGLFLLLNVKYLYLIMDSSRILGIIARFAVHVKKLSRFFRVEIIKFLRLQCGELNNGDRAKNGKKIGVMLMLYRIFLLDVLNNLCTIFWFRYSRTTSCELLWRTSSFILI